MTSARRRLCLRRHRSGKHILRGGYGLYFGNIFQNIPLFMIQQATPRSTRAVFSLTQPSDMVPGQARL